MNLEIKSCIKDLKKYNKCKYCKKGPCLGDLMSGETTYTLSSSLYFCRGKAYLKMCSINIKKYHPNMIKVVRKNAGYIVYGELKHINFGYFIGEDDILVDEIYLVK